MVDITSALMKTSTMKLEGGIYFRLLGIYGSDALAHYHAKELRDIIEISSENGLTVWKIWYPMQDQEFGKREYDRYMKESQSA